MEAEIDGFRPTDDRMADVIAELQARIEGGEGTVRTMIYRQRQDGEKVYLAQVPAEAFTLDWLRDQYGGGGYVISVAVSGRRGIPPRTWRVQVEAPRGWRPPVDPTDVPAPVVTAPAKDHTYDAIIEQMTRDRDRSDRILESLLTSLRPPDPAVQMQSMLAMMQAVQAMQPAPVPAPAGLDGLALTERVFELAKTIAPRGDASGTDVLLEAVHSIVPVLREAMVDQRTVPVPAPAPAVQDKDQGQDQEGEADMVAERMFMAQLIGGAQAGQQPAQWIAPVLRVVPADKARAFLTGPEALETLASIDDRVMQHEDWFRKLGTLVAAQLDQDEVGHGDDGAVLSA